jgi:hypothetical protein
VDELKLRAGQPSQAQSDRLASNARASCRCFKAWSTVDSTYQARFGNWGMSWMGIMPRLTRTPEIFMICCDSHSASATCSPSIPTTRVQAVFSSADRSLLPEGCRPRSISSASIVSLTSRSVSCRQRRVSRSSSARPRYLNYPGWELEAHTWVEKPHCAVFARARSASHLALTSPSVRAYAVNPSSHAMTTPSRLSGSLS